MQHLTISFLLKKTTLLHHVGRYCWLSLILQPCFIAFSQNTSLNTQLTPLESTLENNKLIILKVSSRNKGHENFYLDLLQQALTQSGYRVEIRFIGQFSYVRQIKYLEHGKINLIWRVRLMLI